MEPMSVAALLTNKADKLITVASGASINEALAMLAEHKIGALVVADGDGHIAGILSERDVVRGLAERGPSVLTQTVGDLMTAPVQTCTRSDGVDTIMRRMTEGHFRHMPVVEGTRLVGVISIGDVVKNRMAVLEQEAGAMRDYIMSG
jgi:CBS domain-containing protein